MSDVPKPPVDRIFVHSPVESGEGVRVIRARGDQLEVGEMRPIREGQALHGEVVKLSPLPEQPRLFDVEVLANTRALAPVSAEAKVSAGGALVPSSPASSAPGATVTPATPEGALRKGPPKVVSEAYRQGWEAIFGKVPSGPDRGLN